jgi:hypothetical protein
MEGIKEEKEKIAQKLEQMTPENLEDLCALIGFAMEELVFVLGSHTRRWRGMKVLENVRNGISKTSTKMTIESIDRQLEAVEEARREFVRNSA